MPEENKYIPKYIKDVPLFLRPDSEQSSTTDYLSHHRNGTDEVSNSEPKIGQGIHDTFNKIERPHIVKQKKSKLKRRGFKKSCTNCGALDHMKEDCLEIPGGKDIETKNIRIDTKDYDTKRDRWYGYDVNEYKDHLANWEQKAKLKGVKDEQEQVQREYDTDEEIELKELGLWEEYTSEHTKKVEGEKIVRLREDKAVYLKDYKNDEVKYDPKSRMIRDDTTGYYNEDNLFVRHKTGEALKFEQFEKRAAWEKSDKNGEESIMNPTLFDKKVKQLTKEQEIVSKKIKTSLLNKYSNVSGDAEESEESDSEFLAIQGSRSHDRSSKYEEDVLINGHTSVWGSWYHDGLWGYSCCKQTERNSFCSK